MLSHSLQRKLPLLKTPEESTWLYHELGRCHMELQDYTAARDLGEKSLTAAQEARDQLWQLNASVLIAQAESKHFLVCYFTLRLSVCYCSSVYMSITGLKNTAMH